LENDYVVLVAGIFHSSGECAEKILFLFFEAEIEDAATLGVESSITFLFEKVIRMLR
jgi:hypothetical protein